MSFERRERLAAAQRDRQMDLPSIDPRPLLHDQAAAGEVAQHAAEIAGVEAELPADLTGGRVIAMQDLVQHTRLRQRERAVGESVLQHADALRVEAIEPAHGGDAVGERLHGAPPSWSGVASVY